MSEYLDLASLDTAILADKGVVCTFKHPETGEKLSIWVRCKGADSEAYQRVADAQLNEVFKQIAKAGKVEQRTAAVVRDEKINALCEMIDEWGGFAKDGQPLDCNMDNKTAFFGWRGYAWALDQLDFFLKDRANFLPK